MQESGRRRRRPAVSCTLCRRRKIRCNRATPCSNCVRSKNPDCIYDNPISPPRQLLGPGEIVLVPAPLDTVEASSLSNSVAPGPITSAGTSRVSTQEIDSLKRKIQELEERLQRASLRPAQPAVLTPDSNIEMSSTRLGGIFHFHRDIGQPPARTRGVTHKRRLFGQSHWMNTISLFQDIWETVEPQLREETPNVFAGIQRCKALARVIKSRRAPPWPSQPTNHPPPKDVADELVDCYLRTVETVFRILHIPTFKRDYEALWVSDTPIDTKFLVQLKLVLAIGASVYDERYTMRASALRWVYEAETWLSEPKFKSRLDIQSLQIHILLLLAREIVGIGGDSVWIAAGALFRKAIYLGLHRDPLRLPGNNTFVAETRRRLWNTILEIALQSSLAAGGPPLLSLNDFDAEPPANFDDDQLAAEDPVPRPADEFTQVSVAIALRKTFPIRLAVVKFLNNLGSSGTYEEAIRLDAELRASYKDLCRVLQNCTGSGRSPSQFATQLVDMLMHGYIAALHIPFFRPALQETAYAFSRKAATEAALRIWYLAYPPAIPTSLHTNNERSHSSRDDFARFLICGSGTFRIFVTHAVFLIAAEFRAQVLEGESLSPLPLRPDLFAAVKDGKEWIFQWIEAGETNIKGYLLCCTIVAQIEGLMRGLHKDDIPPLLIKAAEEAEERCLPVLEAMAAEGLPKETGNAFPEMDRNLPPDIPDDWGFMMPDVFLGAGNMELMGGMFDFGQPMW